MDYGKSSAEQSLLPRRLSVDESSEEHHLDVLELDEFGDVSVSSWPRTLRTRWWPSRLTRRNNQKAFTAAQHSFSRARRRRSLLFRLCRYLTLLPYAVLCFVVAFGLFLPSYSNPPQRYIDLRHRVQTSAELGRANVNDEKIFIAASLYDHNGQLLSGDWAQSVQRLIDILGHDNVFLSVYENDPDHQSEQALDDFHASLQCPSSVVHEHLDLSQLPHVTMADGSQQVQRISFLAKVRNRVLLPLDDERSEAYNTTWDKLLYLNDITFDPIDAANLLFNTNKDEASGRTNYRAACAVDFINPVKFYDTFATRDLEGYNMGVPFYPWFTGAGKGASRQDVLNQTDAVRVKSCWGGMVAFEAKWFQPQLYGLVEGDLVVPHQKTADGSKTGEADTSTQRYQEADAYNDREANLTYLVSVFDSDPHHDLVRETSNLPSILPLRFRSETGTDWTASECCLINADLAHLSPSGATSPGIYMNPYVRVAYSGSVLAWLPVTRRFERLYLFVQTILNAIAQRPSYNPRQFEEPGDEVVDRIWQWDDESLVALDNSTAGELSKGLHGSFQDVKRIASPGQFCGRRRQTYMRERTETGERSWASV
ncbi:hypothetical protein LTR37_017562 [Vermiconidia calcicola]|uniref:Uncharacterized protein n=1 Tax=Vermiconidia calcicola TaxID=1690605 RepID=A0ACC3ML67_9PEZI|nr:hypothetical protein LTR37_017562 [Vermiconidia calcicola]